MEWLLPPTDKEPLYYATPIFVAVILLELVIDYRQKRKLYHRQDTWASLAMGTGSLVVGGAMKILAFTLFSFLHQFALLEIGWQWWAWLLCFFADDFSFYWHHRLSHEVRILWAAHVNHHSSQRLNYSTALRQSWTEILYKYAFWIWMPLLGFEPLMIMVVMSISLIFQFLQHTELVGNLGALEWVFNTPSHHRVHHASNVRYLDRNHAGVLIIWDRLFGTFQKEMPNEKPKYGLTVNIDSYNPLHIATHEFRAIWKDVQSTRNWKEKLKYIFYPPGWTPKGENKTAKHLQQQLKLKAKAN